MKRKVEKDKKPDLTIRTEVEIKPKKETNKVMLRVNRTTVILVDPKNKNKKYAEKFLRKLEVSNELLSAHYRFKRALKEEYIPFE